VPTYQYACTVADCGHEFERVQSFSDSTLTECPECSGRLRKVWGSIGVVFKGSGFYRNDSRAGKDSGKDKADSTAKSDSTGAKSESGKSDASKAKENAGSASAAKQDSGTPTSTSSAGSARSSARSSPGSSPGKATSSPAA